MTLKSIKCQASTALFIAIMMLLALSDLAYGDTLPDSESTIPENTSGTALYLNNDESMESGLSVNERGNTRHTTEEFLSGSELKAISDVSDDQERETKGLNSEDYPVSISENEQAGEIVEEDKGEEPQNDESLSGGTNRNELPGIEDGIYNIASSISDCVCVEIGGASQDNGASANVFANNRTAAQRWKITSLGNGYYKLMNIASGKYLDVGGAIVGNCARVQQYEWNGTNAQLWAIVPASSGYMLYSALSAEYVLDLLGADTSNGTIVQLYESNGTNAQVWSLLKIDSIIDDGLYEIKAACSNKALDVSSGSVYCGANVQQYESNGTMAQSFCFVFDADTGYYTILASASGMALDVLGASSKNGANVQLFTPNGTKAQQWAIEENPDGTLTFYSAIAGMALDVNGASKSDQANVQMWEANGTTAQRWRSTSLGAWTIPEGVFNIVVAANQSNSVCVAGSSFDNGDNVQTAKTSTAAGGQKWVFYKAEDNYYTIRSINSGKALSVADKNPQSESNVIECAGEILDTQLWKPELTIGGILFRSKANPRLVLDVYNASVYAGANVWAYPYNDTVAQKYALLRVNALDNGRSYTFRNVETDLVLDVKGASTEEGAPIWLFENNGTGAQRFYVNSANEGLYCIGNVRSGKYVGIDKTDGGSIKQWNNYAESCAQWAIVLDYASATFRVKSALTGEYLDGSSGVLSLQPGTETVAQCFILRPVLFRVYLDAGHITGANGSYDSGAIGNGYAEADLTWDLTDRIIGIVRDEFGIDVVDGKTFGINYSERTYKAVELGCTALVSIHFNAGGGSGCMGIVGSPERRNAYSPLLAEIMHAHLAQGMNGLHDYGIVTRGDLAIPNNNNMAATLLEVAFVDNYYDMQYYFANRDNVARKLAEGILAASMLEAFNV